MKNVTLNSTEDIISLMELYRSEWKFRSQEFVSYFWRFIYLSLIITFLPNFLNALMFPQILLTYYPTGFFLFSELHFLYSAYISV